MANGRPGSQSTSSGRRRIPTARPPAGKKKRWKRVVLLAVIAAVSLLALASLALYVSLPDVSRLKGENPKTTAFIELRKNQSGSKLKVKWTWRPLGKISPYLRSAVVHAEDGKFWKHGGVDWDAMEAAARRDIAERKLAAGGSTLTQQLAKNLYLSPDKNLIRKLRELFIARRLEAELSKERILELYLNVVEWGPGVFGAEAAARHWYGVSAANLSPDQAARLACALPNPIKRSPKVKNSKLNLKAARLVYAMRGDGILDLPRMDAALETLGRPRPGARQVEDDTLSDDELPEPPLPSADIDAAPVAEDVDATPEPVGAEPAADAMP